MAELVRKTFYFMRHAETFESKKKVVSGGRTDSVLTPRGVVHSRMQHAIYELLEPKPRTIITSGQLRTIFTGIDVAGEGIGTMGLIPDSRLNERDLGDADGRASYETWAAMKASGNIGNAETEQALAARVIGALNEDLQQCDVPPLVVGHSGAMRRIFEAMGVPAGKTIPEAQIFECIPEGGHGWKVNALSVENGNLKREDISQRVQVRSRSVNSADDFMGRSI